MPETQRRRRQLVQCTKHVRQFKADPPLGTSSAIDLFLLVRAVALAFYHDHADKCADDGEEHQDEDDGDLDCPFSRGEEVVQGMISVDKRLSSAPPPGGRELSLPLQGPIGRSRQTAPSCRARDSSSSSPRFVPFWSFRGWVARNPAVKP